jgi:hypothetical protein
MGDHVADVPMPDFPAVVAGVKSWTAAKVDQNVISPSFGMDHLKEFFGRTSALKQAPPYSNSVKFTRTPRQRPPASPSTSL